MNDQLEKLTYPAMRLATIVKASAQRFCFVLGAGASKASGIKTGIEMAREWGKYIEDHAKEFGTARVGQLKKELALDNLAEAENKHYFRIYDCRWHGETQNAYRYIQQQIEKASPSYGYYALAMLLSKTNHNLVITTNFDPLTEDTLNLYTDKKPFVVGHESLAPYIDFNHQRPMVAKLHRDLFLNPFSSESDTKALKGDWKRALDKAFSAYTPIIIGYAGGDQSLMGYLEAESTQLNDGLYWCYRRQDEPSEEIQRLVQRKNGIFIEINSFDSILCLLGNAFGVASPSIDISKTMTARANETVRKYYEMQQKLINEAAAGKDNDEADAVKAILEQGAKREEEKLASKISEKPNAEYYNRQGNLYSIQENYQDAVKSYSKAIELDPEYKKAYYSRGLAFCSLEEYAKGISDFTKAIELDPEDEMAYNNRGLAFDELNEYEKAISDFTEAIKLDPEYEEAYSNRGLVFYGRYEYEKAISDFTKAIELYPEGNVIYYGRGLVFSDLGEYEKGISDFTKAIEIDPEFKTAYKARAKAYRALGRDEEARADEETARNLDANGDHSQ